MPSAAQKTVSALSEGFPKHHKQKGLGRVLATGEMDGYTHIATHYLGSETVLKAVERVQPCSQHKPQGKSKHGHKLHYCNLYNHKCLDDQGH